MHGESIREHADFMFSIQKVMRSAVSSSRVEGAE
jgi:hypothetical protein